MFKIDDKIKLFVFDLDDTLYCGENFPDAIEMIEHLQKKYKVVFYTNNSSQSIFTIYTKLNDRGFKCLYDEVFSSASITALYLKEHNIDNVYVVGEGGLISEIENVGIKVIQNETAKNIVVGKDTEFNYEKISIALSIINKDGKFIACNQDPNFHLTKDIILPGCGAMVGAIAYASQNFPDIIVGKPNYFGLQKISQKFGVTNEEMVVVGDLIDVDIAMALGFKSKAILVYNDVITVNKNLLVFKNISEMFKYCKGEI